MIRKADAVWEGTLREGKGHITVASGAVDVRYSFGTRFADEPGTNPEELIGAAHAGCFSMALSAGLTKAGYTARRIHTSATVSLEKAGEGFKITRIQLETEAEVPRLDEQAFQQQAEAAKKNCPVSVALAGTEISLRARLIGEPAHV